MSHLLWYNIDTLFRGLKNQLQNTSETIKFDSSALTFEAIGTCTQKFEMFCESHDVDPKTTSVGCIIIDEVVNNVVSYSKATKLEVVMDIVNGKVSLTFKDNGTEYDPTKLAKQEADAHKQEGRPGGYGTDIVFTLSDASYKYENGQNVLETIIK